MGAVGLTATALMRQVTTVAAQHEQLRLVCAATPYL